MKVIAIMQARMGASRLPEKIITPLLNQAILSLIIRSLNFMHANTCWVVNRTSGQMLSH
jgi:spore coat polysaccharide biosynthesis protein SpsF (cytidylyltransferase family)